MCSFYTSDCDGIRVVQCLQVYTSLRITAYSHSGITHTIKLILSLISATVPPDLITPNHPFRLHQITLSWHI